MGFQKNFDDKDIDEDHDVLMEDIKDSDFKVEEPPTSIHQRYSSRSGKIIDKQDIIIHKLQCLDKRLEQHHDQSAKSSELSAHDLRLHELCQSNDKQRELLIKLHSELQKVSLRHRVSVLTSLAVLVNTTLLLFSMLFDSIIIEPRSMALILLGTIVFWILGRAIPKMEPLNVEEHNA